MSNYSTTLDARAAIDTASRPATKGFWHRMFDRIVAGRQAQADRMIADYIKGLPEQQRKDLGFPTATDRR